MDILLITQPTTENRKLNNRKPKTEQPKPRAEGFARQRLIRLPQSVVRRMTERPFLRDFMVTDIGHFPEAPGHRVRRRRGSPSHVLLFVESGRGWIRLGERRHAVRANDAVWLPPDTKHAYGADPEAPWGLYWIHFRGGGATDLLAWTGATKERPVRQGVALETVRRHLNAAMDRLDDGFTDSALLDLARHAISVMVHLHRDPAGPTGQQSDAARRIARSMEYMREHLADPLDLRACARAAGYSVAQYSAHFRKQCGTPPMHYLRELRIQTASRQLDQTRRPVKTIAAAVGYPDPLHFSRVFRAVTGLSPSQYRNRVNG